MLWQDWPFWVKSSRLWQRPVVAVWRKTEGHIWSDAFPSVFSQSPATCRLRYSSPRSSTMGYSYSSRQNSIRAHTLALTPNGTIYTYSYYVASKIGSNSYSLCNWVATFKLLLRKGPWCMLTPRSVQEFLGRVPADPGFKCTKDHSKNLTVQATQFQCPGSRVV